MGRFKRREPSAPEISSVEAEIIRIHSAGINDLRDEWRAMFKREVPKALTKGLLARMICFRIQEEAYGGFDRATLNLLESYAKGRPPPTNTSRRFKPGTELFREYQGTRHAVVAMDNGGIVTLSGVGHRSPRL